jgi:hypothetical protein
MSKWQHFSDAWYVNCLIIITVPSTTSLLLLQADLVLYHGYVPEKVMQIKIEQIEHKIPI